MLLQRVSEASGSLPGKQRQLPTVAGLCGHPVLDMAREGHLWAVMAQVPFHIGVMMSAWLTHSPSFAVPLWLCTAAAPLCCSPCTL